MKIKFLLWMTWGASLLSPAGVWLLHTGNPTIYFSVSAPPGQGFYVTSKLLGCLIVVILWWQALLGLMPTIANRWLGRYRLQCHRWHGSVVMLLILLHIAGFIAGPSLRGGKVALHYLWFDFGDYYHARIALGAIAFYAVLLAVLHPLLRWRSKLSFPLLHWLGVGAFFLACWHGLAIGSETRHPLILAQLYMMQFILMLALLSKARGKINTSMLPSFGGSAT